MRLSSGVAEMGVCITWTCRQYTNSWLCWGTPVADLWQIRDGAARASGYRLWGSHLEYVLLAARSLDPRGRGVAVFAVVCWLPVQGYPALIVLDRAALLAVLKAPKEKTKIIKYIKSKYLTTWNVRDTVDCGFRKLMDLHICYEFSKNKRGAYSAIILFCSAWIAKVLFFVLKSNNLLFVKMFVELKVQWHCKQPAL